MLVFLRSIILTILFLTAVLCFAQKEANIWHFGNKAGIDFNTSPPTALTNGKMNTLEGCASIADKNGQLLFYTNGETVWNKNHKEMPNGFGLSGHNSSAQSAIIVRLPGSLQIYYVFTVDGSSGKSKGYHYSIIDMSLDNGNGDVTDKNRVLVTPSSHEGVTAVKHSNDQDIWVLYRAPGKGLLAYLLTSGGLQKPIETKIGPDAFLESEPGRWIMKFSPDGKCAVTGCNSYWTLYKFDNTTGIFTDAITFTNKFKLNYAYEFSPNSQILYRNERYGITQYSLVRFEKSSILNSKTLIHKNGIGWNFGSLQLGPDLKIYISRHDRPALDVIHKPDRLGIACQYTFEDFHLQGGVTKHGLPGFVQSIFSRGITALNKCTGDSTEFSATIPTSLKYDSLKWFFGDNFSTELFSRSENPKYTFSSPGTYPVKLILYMPSGNDTIERSVNIVSLPHFTLREDTVLCEAHKLQLYPKDGQFIENTWWASGISTDTIITQPSLANYKFTATNDCGSHTDSVFITHLRPPNFELRSDTSICSNDGTNSIKLYPLQLGHYSSLVWSTNETTDTISISQPGTYVLTDSNVCGSHTREVTISVTNCKSILSMPNVFTPNNDGSNDLFLPIEIDQVQNTSISIFNRWGERVYESVNLNTGWDGTFNGKLLPHATYFWIITYESTSGEEETLNGTVDLR